MNALRIQGIVFSVVAILLTAATIAIKRLDEQMELIVLAVLIVLLGVPHGALDTIFARQLYDVKTVKGWAAFTLAYLFMAALAVVLWQVAPLVFLLGFLVISIAHFSGDPSVDMPVAFRILYGGAIVVLPTLLHAEEVTRLFSILAGADVAALLVLWLHFVSWPWLIGIAVAAVGCARLDWLAGVEIASVGLLSVLTPPLVAFTIFFCGMHSARHILRTVDYSGRRSPYLLISASVAPMLAFLVMLGAALLWLRDIPIEVRVIQLVFVGLAALTVPHMALVERVRLSGWVKGAAPG